MVDPDDYSPIPWQWTKPYANYAEPLHSREQLQRGVWRLERPFTGPAFQPPLVDPQVLFPQFNPPQATLSVNPPPGLPLGQPPLGPSGQPPSGQPQSGQMPGFPPQSAPFASSDFPPLDAQFNQPRLPASRPPPFSQPTSETAAASGSQSAAQTRPSNYQLFGEHPSLLSELDLVKTIPEQADEQQPNQAGQSATQATNQPSVRANQLGALSSNQLGAQSSNQLGARPSNPPGIQLSNQLEYPVSQPPNPFDMDFGILSYPELQTLSDVYRETLKVDLELPSAEPRGLRELIDANWWSLTNEPAGTSNQPLSSVNPAVKQGNPQLVRMNQLIGELTYQRLIDLNRMHPKRLNVDEFRAVLNALTEAIDRPLIHPPPFAATVELPEWTPPSNLASWLAEVEKFIPEHSNSIQGMIRRLNSQVEQPAGQSTGQRLVEIDPCKDSTSSDHVRFYESDQSTEENNRDVVLVHQHVATFNNRWKPAELVDSQVVRFWTAGPIVLDCLNLKRIKIYGLSVTPQHNLLKFLAADTKVQELEIDTLNLLEARRNVVYNFESLRLFSVDSIRIYDVYGQAVEREELPASVNAPNLNTLFLGSEIGQLLLPRSKPLLMTSLQYPHLGSLVRHWPKYLLVLMINPISLSLEQFLPLVDGKTVPLLLHLYVNVNKLDCTSTVALNPTRGNELREFYQGYQKLYQTGKLRPALNTYINGVRLDLTRPFEDYHFDQKLVEQHARNQANGFVVRPCHSVRSTNFVDVDVTYPFERSFAAAVSPMEQAAQLYAPFHELYPNIQTVKLVGPFTRGPPAAVFITFLNTCKGLTELAIYGSEYSRAFCEQRANLKCCPALHVLSLFSAPEEPNSFDHNLQFLTEFTCLRRFHTNLASPCHMAQVVSDGLEIGQELRFRFKLNSDISFDSYIRRVESNFGGGPNWGVYELEFEQISLSKGNSWSPRKLFDTLSELLVHLNDLRKDASIPNRARARMP